MSSLKTNRGVIKLIFLSGITFGIYTLFFISKLAKDLNKVCDGDGKRNAGLIKLILLSAITFGIYGIVWWCKAAGRISAYGKRNNVNVSTSVGNFILWSTLGCLLFCLGPMIAMGKLLKSMNKICKHAQEAERAAAAVVVEEAPAEEAPAEEAPAEEAPAEEAPAEEAPAEEAPAEEAPAEEAPAEEAPAEEAPAEEAPAEEAPAEEAPAEEAAIAE